MVCKADVLMPIFVLNKSKNLRFMEHQVQLYLSSLKGMALPLGSFQIEALEETLLTVKWNSLILQLR